ncbi:MAG: tyrosine-type recombinase/integrase, partial [Nannocystaceae bacterium]
MYEVTCARLPGFVVRVLPSGQKVFLVRSLIRGRSRRVRIGIWSPALSLDAARQQALSILAGRDEPASPPEPAPSSVRSREPARVERPAARIPERSRPSATPLRDLAQRFLDEYVDVYLCPGTAANYRRCIEKYIIPALGDRPFDTITRQDALALHRSLKDRPAVADHTVCTLGSMYTRIIDDWELTDIRNPTSRVRKFGSRRVERFLSPEERQALMSVLEEGLRISPGMKGHLAPFTVWAIRLLMLTGLRRNEILELTWTMVDWQHSLLNLPTTKTGQRTVLVSREVLSLLREIHEAIGRPARGLVLRGRGGSRIKGLNRAWEVIRVAAGIPDVRLHDLRHSFASDALMSGVPLAVVGELLGHKQPSTTKRYAHLASDVVRDALEQATRRIVRSSTPAKAAPRAFVPLRDSQWEKIAPIVEGSRKPGGRAADLRAVVDGIRWVLERKAK